MSNREFRAPASYASEGITRAMVPGFLRQRDFTDVKDSRKSHGRNVSQTINATLVICKLSLLAILIGSCANVAAQTRNVDKKVFNFAPALEKDLGFSRAVRVGETLYISGSVGSGEMPDAIREAYDRIQRTLEAHGLTFQNVVKETLFTTDLEAFHKHREIRKGYYGSDFPATSWVQVSRLNSPELVIEVEAIAVFPETKGSVK